MGVSGSQDDRPGRERRLIDDVLDEMFDLSGVESTWADAADHADPSGPSADSFPGYEVHGEVHRGAQGVVYRAVHRGTARPVAIKAMRAGSSSSPREAARFEREEHILGRLDHPNIVTIHDTGQSAGQFYYVMDYIDGQPLDAYLAGRDAPIAQILRLFVKICDAVNAAHLRGVIHRDLKPGNILIDSDGEPHVLDFGLAKISERNQEEAAAVATVAGQFIGSLPWSSPEQAEGNLEEIDVRTDVYSLGVILYQMLTGEFPYAVTGSTRDVLNNIVNAEPIRPGALRRQINDDLETIVLKCLSKERDRRYQSAGELARDVRHDLANEPIGAKRDSGWYVLRKTLGRYRIHAAIAVAFTLMLAVATVALSVMYGRAEAARADAAREAEKANAVTGALSDMVMSVRWNRGGGSDLTVREMLDGFAQTISPRFDDQPEIEAAVRETLGETYYQLSMLEPAELHLRRSVELRSRVLGEAHPDTLVSMRRLATVLGFAHKAGEAEPLFEFVLDAERRLFGDEGDRTRYTTYRFAEMHYHQGRLAEAERLYLRAQPVLDGSSRIASGDLFYVRSLAAVLWDRGKLPEAEQILRDALEAYDRGGGPGTWNSWRSRNKLGKVLLESGRPVEAEALLRRALEVRRRIEGEEHTLIHLGNIAAAIAEQGRLGEAESMLRELLQRATGRLEVARTKHELARVLVATGGDLAEAEDLFSDALEHDRTSVPEDHWKRALREGRYGNCLALRGKFGTAENLLLTSHARLAASLGAEHVRTQEVLAYVVALYDAWGKPEEAAEASSALRRVVREFAAGEDR